METGLLLATAEGPFVYCGVCRTLYFVDIIDNGDGTSIVTVEPAGLAPEAEFDIIRQAIKQTPLQEYMNVPNERMINPHFQENLKSLITKSVTPSDFIRKLHDYHD